MPAVPVGHHPVTNSKYCTAPETVDGDLRGCTQKETYASQSYSSNRSRTHLYKAELFSQGFAYKSAMQS